MPDKVEKLSPEEFVEMDELLATIPEEFEAMDACEADGFMTALALLPKKPSTREWVPEILSTLSDSSASTGMAQSDKRLRSLLQRRLLEIENTLRSSELLDPLYFEPEDEEGEPLKGAESVVALEPFAMGFLEATQKWPGILDNDSPIIARSLPGIFRHLPTEALGDFAKIKESLDREAPLEDLPSALSDLADCIAEIAAEIKGYALPELSELSEPEEKA